MKILLLNQAWFAEEFKQFGHEVKVVAQHGYTDYEAKHALENINDIIIELNFQPDLVIVYDDSTALIFYGFEQLSVPCIFYSVDTHHHFLVHRYLTNFFDLTYVAHKDYLQGLRKFSPAANIKWLPLWASSISTYLDQKEYGAVFVGTLNKHLNPERVKFFEELQKKVDVFVTSGDFTDIFPKAKIVINQTVKGDLNFRVFEAMSSGSMLLTEESSNGLLELFENNKHLVTYKRNDIADAAGKIEYYLRHEDEAKKIGCIGRQEILKKHTSLSRAKEILADIASLNVNLNRQRYFPFISNYVWKAQLMLGKSDSELPMTFKLIFSYMLLGIKAKERVNNELASVLVFASFMYKELFSSDLCDRMISLLYETYPESVPIQLAKIKLLVLSGDVDSSIMIGKKHFPLLQYDYLMNVIDKYLENFFCTHSHSREAVHF